MENNIKSIKDNKETNFQKWPDNFNFKLNGIKTEKPNLKAAINTSEFKEFILQFSVVI